MAGAGHGTLRIPAHLTGVDRALALLEHARAIGRRRRRASGPRAARRSSSAATATPELSAAARRLAWSKDGLAGRGARPASPAELRGGSPWTLERPSATLVDRAAARRPRRRDPERGPRVAAGASARRTRVVRLGLAGALVACHRCSPSRSCHDADERRFLPGDERRDRRARPLDERPALDLRPDPRAAAGTSSTSSRRFGVVLFSDVAYEALPPATPARELRTFVRFFRSGYRYDEDGNAAPAVAVGAVVLGRHVDLVGAPPRGAAPRAADVRRPRGRPDQRPRRRPERPAEAGRHGRALLAALDPAQRRRLSIRHRRTVSSSSSCSTIRARSATSRCRRRRPAAARSRSQARFPWPLALVAASRRRACSR